MSTTTLQSDTAQTSLEKRPRLPNWSESERVLCVKIINGNYEKLFTKFKGATLGAKKKEEVWQGIADELNSSGLCQFKRTVEQIKTMYKNVKSRAKGKEGEKRKTGGGPPISMTSCEEEALQKIRERPQVTGIDGGIDSTAEVVTGQKEKTQKCDLPSDTSASLDAKSMMETFVKESLDCGHKRSRPRKNSNLSSEEDLCELEKKRARLEIKLLEQRQEFEEEKSQVEMKLLNQRLILEKDVLTLKKEILQKQFDNLVANPSMMYDLEL